MNKDYRIVQTDKNIFHIEKRTIRKEYSFSLLMIIEIITWEKVTVSRWNRYSHRECKELLVFYKLELAQEYVKEKMIQYPIIHEID